jgi:hypothetical protein
VDKDGRSSIKCGRKSQCDHIKSQVEVNKAQTRCYFHLISYFSFKTIMAGHMNTTPLETKVMHQSLIAHQYFAEKIITWLQKFTENSSKNRNYKNFCYINSFSQLKRV